jgi:nucleotide-binding universal stress UspA family protein
LVATAKRAKADLLVVASPRKNALLQRLAGSVAERIAQNATIPTLVVREDESLLAWTRGDRPLHIAVGYDFSTSADAALRFAAALRTIGPCRITVTYVSWPPNETLRFGIGGDTSKPGNAPEVQRLLERDLKERCNAVFGSELVEVRVISSWTREDSKLIELATDEHADLLIVGTNQRTGLDRFWLGSVSRAVLRHAAMNVICVPLAEYIPAPDAAVPTFERVLVPIDFSKSAVRAIPIALSAVKRGGEVRLLHVMRPIGGFRSKDKNRKRRRAEIHKRIAAELQGLIPLETHEREVQNRVEVVEHEHPSIAISQAAERFGADLICLGSQGKSSLKKKLLGSVTQSVMRRSKRPVLVVRN